MDAIPRSSSTARPNAWRSAGENGSAARKSATFWRTWPIVDMPESTVSTPGSW